MGAIKESIDQSIQFFLGATEKPMAVIDLNGVICEKNKSFAHFFCVKQGENIAQVIRPQSIKKFENILKTIEPEQSKVCHFYMALGHQREQIIQTNLFYNYQNNLIILLFTIPTEIRGIPSQNWLNEFMCADSLLFLCRQDGHIQEGNHLSFDYFNLPTEYFIGNDIESIFALCKKEPFEIEETRKQILNGKNIEVIGKYQHPIKETQYYKITTIHHAKSDCFVLKISDYTEKVKLKQQLEKDDSSQAFTQLAATIVHEVRNPMTTLKGFTQLLKCSANKDAMKYLTVIDGEIERMESILSEMLTLAKPVKDKKKPFSIQKLLNEIIQVILPKATMEKIEVVQSNELDAKLMILGDERRLKQVFLNLFKNALEAMRPGGVLTICLQHCGTSQVNIIIEDTGKGIEEPNLTQVFMPYFTTKPDGTGLGMPFVLQTIEDHNGTISVSSEVGKGTSFILALPVS